MPLLRNIFAIFLLTCPVWALPQGSFKLKPRSISTTLSRITNGISSQQANQESLNPSYSNDGRYVAFESSASNLVSGDTNGLSDIFLYDTQTSTMTKLSVGLSGAQANGPSFEPKISADGAYVVFSSFASNLVTGDTNGKTDIFRIQVNTGTIIRISVDNSGSQANESSAEPSISGDGNLITYTSKATNLVFADTNGKTDIFMRDVYNGMTIRMSVDSYYNQGDGDSFNSKISSDGSLIVFTSDSTNLIASDTNGCSDVFIRDRATPLTFLISSSTSGVIGNRSSWKADISSNGQYVVFQSRANNLIASDANGYVDVFLKNTSTGATALMSQTSSGNQVKYDSVSPSISADGRFVVFESLSPGFVAWDTNNASDVYIHDNFSGLTTPFSTITSDVVGDKKSITAKISGDGTKFGFVTLATNLVTPDTNGQYDILSRSNPLTGQVVNVTPIADLDESAGTQNAFTVTRYGSTASALTVSYSVSGMATSGTDYTALSGSVTIASGSSTAVISVPVTSDTIVEGNESIIITLTPNSSYIIGGKDSASVNILPDDLFTVEITATDNVLYEDGLNNGNFRVTRAGGTMGDLIVNLSYSGTATPGMDYVSLPTSVIIPAGQSYVDIAVVGIEDQIGESDESIAATVVTGSGYNIGTNSSATATLKDNDQFEVNVTATDSIADESNPSDTGNFRIDRGTTGMQNLVVNYVLKGTAQNGVDYVSLPGTITISAPNQYVDVPITVISDSLVEGYETVVLEILPGDRYTPGPSQTATVVIKEDSPLPMVSISATDAVANEAGTDSGTIRISRTGSTSSSLAMYFSVGGTATNGSDYTSISSPVTIPSGQAYVDITITGIEDTLVEPTETVVLGLQSASTYQVDPVASRAEVDIFDNDLPTVQIVRGNQYANENQKSKGQVTVSRTGDLSIALTVNLSYSGTATAGSDYVNPGTTVTIPAGASSQSIDISAIANTSVQGNRKAVIGIGSASGYTVGTNSSTEITIVDGTYKVFADIFGITSDADVNTVSVSDDGRYIVFASAATNLVSGDTNGVSDIFRADLVSHTITRVLGMSGAQPNGASRSPSISADGRYVAFSSLASNFYQDDFNSQEDVFLYDFNTGTAAYVSKGYTYLSQGGSSFDPAISQNGDYVVFASSATNLVVGDANDVADIFLFTKSSGALERINLKSDGSAFTLASARPSVSADGNLISFESKQAISGDTDLYEDVLLRNRQAGTLTRISSPLGGTANDGYSGRAKVSGNGRTVIFQSYSSNIAQSDLNSASDIFGYNVESGSKFVVSQSAAGWIGTKASSTPSLDSNGEFGLFISGSRNFGGGFNCSITAYSKSLYQNTIMPIDNGSLTNCSSPVQDAVISQSGKYVVAILATDVGFREILISTNPLK